jgi:hypothetical protein
MESITRYGEKYECLSDNYIFYPIASKLLEPFHKLNLTPNHITYLSTFFTLLSIYYLHNNMKTHTIISYLIGYILDCADGSYARKYNMKSQYGMVIDSASDMVSNEILILYLIYKYGFNRKILLLLCVSLIFSISYGLNEAIASFKENGNDNFYEKKKLELGDKDELIYKIYLYHMKISYETYRFVFPTFDEKNVNKWLNILREFGPGNHNLFMCFILYNL